MEDIQVGGWFKVHSKLSVMAQDPLPPNVIMTLIFPIVWKCPLNAGQLANILGDFNVSYVSI